jgi:hypothetical protein
VARGDQQSLDPVSEQTGLAVEDWSADTFEVRLMSDDYATGIGYTTLASFTEVSGGSYAAKACAVTWTRSGSKSTLQAANVSWGLDASGPQDIRTAALVNVTQSTAITVTDLTTDGTTPLDNQAAPINVNYALTPTLEVDR